MNREELLKEINNMTNYELASLLENGRNTCEYCNNKYRDKICLETDSCTLEIEKHLNN